MNELQVTINGICEELEEFTFGELNEEFEPVIYKGTSNETALPDYILEIEEDEMTLVINYNSPRIELIIQHDGNAIVEGWQDEMNERQYLPMNVGEFYKELYFFNE